ncbi:hypothetical protein ACFLRA_02315 [Bdellovibrionota bacterium]
MKRFVIFLVLIIAIALIVYFVLVKKPAEVPTPPVEMEEAVPEVPEVQPGAPPPAELKKPPLGEVPEGLTRQEVLEKEIKNYNDFTEAVEKIDTLYEEKINALRDSGENPEELEKLEADKGELAKALEEAKLEINKRQEELDKF